MTGDNVLRAIAEAGNMGRWAMTRHAREQSGKRMIGDEALMRALAWGEILESYPNDPRGASCLILGHDETQRPVHAVVAFDASGILVVITLYEPGPPKWIDERTRRTPERREQE